VRQGRLEQDRGIVIRSVFAAALGLGALASGAIAAELSIKGSTSQTFDASNNYFLSTAPSGATARSLSALNLDFLARTPTTDYDLRTNYSYYKYFGPGAVDTSPTSGTPASVNFNVDHRADPLTKFNFAASWQRSDIASTQLLQNGIVTAHGSVDTYNATAGVTRDITRRDSLSWQTQATTASFSVPGQTPYDDVTSTGVWTHRLSQTTSLINTASVNWDAQDDPAQDRRLFWTVKSGLQVKPTSRLTIDGAVGVNFLNAWQKNGGQANTPAPPPTPGFPFSIPAPELQPGAGSSWLGNVGLTYQLLKHTQVSLTAVRATTPTVLGNLQQSSSIAFNLRHDINYFSNFSITAQFADITQGNTVSGILSGSGNVSGATTSDLFSAWATYEYRLTKELRTSFTYTYSQLNSISGLAKSNTVTVYLTRDFTVLP